MVIGRGDIASVIQDREGFTFFATGVSNRYPIDAEQKLKEVDDIVKAWQANPDKMFVYISTLSIYYSDSEYTKHKITMENFVKMQFKKYCIFRIGNITWGSNPMTLVNYLKRHRDNIQETYRYLITKDELNHWLGMIPGNGKHEMNCTGERISITHLVQRIENNLI